MSGGHYDYLCFKVREFAEMMHTSTERFNEDGTANDSPPQDLRRVRFKKLMLLCADACKDIEWCDSGDSGPEPEKKSIDKCFEYARKP